MKNIQEKRIRLKKKIRAKILGGGGRPRLSVFRSNAYIYAQIIDDKKGVTLVSASDLKNYKDGKKGLPGTKSERAKIVGKEVSKLARKHRIIFRKFVLGF